MRNLHRNLLAETEAGVHNLNTTFNPISNCTTLLSNCYLSNGHCICTSPLSPPSKPSQSHLVSYIISAVCALGVAFLILSTCTILLRQRWGRRSRRNSDLRTARGLVLMGEDRDHHGGPIDHPIWHINTVGLPQSVINEITSFKYRKLGGMLTDGRRDGADCLVCLAEFQDGDDLRLLPKCCHAFHLECIDTWLLSHTNCPLCRAPIVNVSVNEPGDSDGGLRSGLSESEHGSTRVMNLVNENGSLCDGGTGEGGGGGESSEEGNRKSDYFAELRMEWGRIAEFVKSNRKPIRVLSDLSGNHRMMGGVSISSCGDVNHQQQQQQAGIGRSASLDVSSSAMSSSGFMVDVVCSEASSSYKQEKGVSHSDDVEKTVSSIGLTLQKPVVAPSSPAVISMNRSLSSSSGKKCPFRGSKRHASILPL